jgi:hypothetical protein
MLAYMKLLDAPEAALQQISGTADEDQAQAFYEFRLQALKDYGVDEYRMAIGFAQTGEADLAMASLQKAINNSNFMIPCAWADYGFKSLRQLPNFTNMMAAAVIR